ncbi:MAG: PQQ-binding-like beta-propeller repeat protein [Pirellulaceae bacterium]|nr:PQQ-binding-like beta-propeller repeat protein [Pirellulaceae bacterium]
MFNKTTLLNKTTLRISLVLFVLLMTSFQTAVAEDWGRFRGPRADGTTADSKIPTTWSDKENVKWKLALPGGGFSSPIVVGKQVLVTAYSESGNGVKRHLVSVDRATGKAQWTKSIEGVSDGGGQGFSYHGQASHTPVSDGERVYVMFGSSGVIAYDLAGEQLWKKDVGNERRARFGTAASPILHGDLLIVAAGSESESIRAFNKKTGEEVWKTEAGSLSQSYSTPLIAKNAKGGEDLLISVAYEVWSMNPATGKLKWYAETQVDTAACPAIIAKDGVAYVIGGRSGGRAAIRIDGKDDVTDSSVLWSERGGSYVPSPVLHNGRLFWINDRGVASCVDTKTGKEVGQKRISGRFYSSVLLAGDKLYAVSRFGGTYVLKATPKFEQIALNKLTDESDFSGSPAVSDGQLFIRSDTNLYCIAAE